MIKKWFELSRLNFTNCLKANENYFELAGVSSYQEFELWEVDCIARTSLTHDARVISFSQTYLKINMFKINLQRYPDNN